MTVTGLFNPSHILRVFLSHEYAFEIKYPHHVVRIAHSKGSWDLAKIKDNVVIDFLTVQDCASGITCTNEMTLALFQTFASDAWDSVAPDERPGRDRDATYIEDALRIWGGVTKTIEEITVVQPGRNACIDHRTGDFYLSSRANEFKK